MHILHIPPFSHPTPKPRNLLVLAWRWGRGGTLGYHNEENLSYTIEAHLINKIQKIAKFCLSTLRKSYIKSRALPIQPKYICLIFQPFLSGKCRKSFFCITESGFILQEELVTINITTMRVK